MNIEIPNEKLFDKDIESIFENPNIQGRGDNYFREAIRYFHWPYGEVHQESLKSGDFHKNLRRLTISMLYTNSQDYVNKIIWSNFEDWIKSRESLIFTSNLFIEIRPLIISIFFELLFDQKISSAQLRIYNEAIANMHNTMKGIALRSKKVRVKMYEDIQQQLKNINQLQVFKSAKLQDIPQETLAKHIGGVFFHTGVVQTTEFITHTLVEIYRNQEIKDNLRQFIQQSSPVISWEVIEQYKYLDYILNESLRLFPLFGKTDRQVTKSLTIKDILLKEGSIIYLNFSLIHKLHWNEPDSFNPSRWGKNQTQIDSPKLSKAQFIPFGIGSRKCPAETFTYNMTKVIVFTIFKRINLSIPSNFIHTRRIPRGVPIVFSLNDDSRQLYSDEESVLNLENKLLISLENRHSLSYEVDELAGLSILGTFTKIINNLKYYGISNFSAFSPLITRIQIWFIFQIKQIQKFRN
ncbi:MAG: cytochrome P450 [Calothrix sp. MO_167.B42]|nr:cytochrome P450 [Calothrix sp. MO_167.B42]